MNSQKKLREHVLELLEGKSAHIDLTTVLNEFPLDEINTRIENAPHTAWELLEHLQIALTDIVEFSTDPNHVSPPHPQGYWNEKTATADDWSASRERIFADLQKMRDLVSDEKTDLFAEIPGGTGQTLLREALLIADHNTYHLGQIAFVMRTLEAK